MKIDFPLIDITTILNYVKDNMDNLDFISYEEIEAMLTTPIRPRTDEKATTQWKGYISARNTLIDKVNSLARQELGRTDDFFILRKGVTEDEDLDNVGCSKLQGDSIAGWRLEHHKMKLRNVPTNAYYDLQTVLKLDNQVSKNVRVAVANFNSSIAQLDELREQMLDYISTHVRLPKATKKRLGVLSAEHDDPEEHFAKKEEK
jgi:hypothetical protein